MKRIAFCISGEIRTWSNSSIDGESPEQTIIRAIENLRSKGYVVDVYGSTWDYCDKVDETIFKRIDYNDSTQVKSWVDNTLFPKFKSVCKEIIYTSDGLFNAYGQIWNILNAFKIAGPSYDLYIRTRFDSKIESDWNDVISETFFHKEENKPIINLSGAVIDFNGKNTKLKAACTDIVSIIDSEYWKLLFDNIHTIENIMENMYTTSDEFSEYFIRIYNQSENITYISSLRKQKLVRERDNYNWYYSVTDADKCNMKVRPT